MLLTSRLHPSNKPDRNLEELRLSAVDLPAGKATNCRLTPIAIGGRLKTPLQPPDKIAQTYFWIYL